MKHLSLAVIVLHLMAGGVCAQSAPQGGVAPNPFEKIWKPSEAPMTPQQRFARRWQECIDKGQSGQFHKYIDAADCFNAARHAFALETGFPWMDLEEQYEREKHVLAEKMDAKKITTMASIKSEAARIDAWFKFVVNNREIANQPQQFEQPLTEEELARRLAILNAVEAMGPTTTTCDPGFGGSFECTTNH
jgi:hypothetical protein